jgi:hypothetical protein
MIEFRLRRAGLFRDVLSLAVTSFADERNGNMKKVASMRFTTSQRRVRLLRRLLVVIKQTTADGDKAVNTPSDESGLNEVLQAQKKQILELLLRRIGRDDRGLIEHLRWQLGPTEYWRQRYITYLLTWVETGEFFPEVVSATAAY